MKCPKCSSENVGSPAGGQRSCRKCGHWWFVDDLLEGMDRLKYVKQKQEEIDDNLAIISEVLITLRGDYSRVMQYIKSIDDVGNDKTTGQ